MSEYTLCESVSQEINYYFVTDKEMVYNAFVKLITSLQILSMTKKAKCLLLQ